MQDNLRIRIWEAHLNIPSWAVPDDKEDHNEKTESPQTGIDDMPTGLPIRDPSPSGNTNDGTEPAQNLFKEQVKHDWSRLMQEEENGSSAMVVENDSTEQSSQRKTVPYLRDGNLLERARRM
jgi:hypothetical protein